MVGYVQKFGYTCKGNFMNRGTRIYLTSNGDQEKKKPHLISNVFKILKQLRKNNIENKDLSLQEKLGRQKYLKLVYAMTEIDLIELNCRLLNQI